MTRRPLSVYPFPIRCLYLITPPKMWEIGQRIP
jgi:hypothetical protein